MTLFSIRKIVEQEENEYLKQEKALAYVNGTDDQYQDDAEYVRDNLYGNCYPKGADAFSRHDPFMDEDAPLGGYYQKWPINWVGWFGGGIGNPESENIYNGSNGKRLRIVSLPHGARKLITEVYGKVVEVVYEHTVTYEDNTTIKEVNS